jgi:hypothetical protein
MTSPIQRLSYSAGDRVLHGDRPAVIAMVTQDAVGATRYHLAYDDGSSSFSATLVGLYGRVLHPEA